MFLDSEVAMKRGMLDIERQFLINGVYSAFSFAWDDTFVFHGESHDFWEIVFITAGEVEVVEDGKVYTLGKNNMILHAPLEFHRIRSKSGEEPHGFILSFRVMGELPRELRHGIFILTEAEKERYLSICQRASDFLAGDTHSSYIGQEVADTLSAFLIDLSSATANRSVANSPTAAEYRKIVAAMTAGVCENLTLADFAAKCNISISYLKLLFKKYAGISPKAYFTHLRVQHAAKLLEEHTITEVSDAMNFSSPNYFSTFFKKQTGTLPSEYKKA
jgi:AraC-like DNA-binding protein